MASSNPIAPNAQRGLAASASRAPCLVFAYGSNMCRERMLARVASAVSLGIGTLPRHRLAFHKRGIDGSAKADALFTGNERDMTWGVIYAIDVQHKPALDRLETVGVGYESVTTSIQMSNGDSVHAWTYRALRTAIEEGLKPFPWYMGFVLTGACQHSLPDAYMRFLRTIKTVPDPDAVRSQSNERILTQ